MDLAEQALAAGQEVGAEAHKPHWCQSALPGEPGQASLVYLVPQVRKPPAQREPGYNDCLLEALVSAPLSPSGGRFP